MNRRVRERHTNFGAIRGWLPFAQTYRLGSREMAWMTREKLYQICKKDHLVIDSYPYWHKTQVKIQSQTFLPLGVTSSPRTAHSGFFFWGGEGDIITLNTNE